MFQVALTGPFPAPPPSLLLELLPTARTLGTNEPHGWLSQQAVGHTEILPIVHCHVDTYMFTCRVIECGIYWVNASRKLDDESRFQGLHTAGNAHYWISMSLESLELGSCQSMPDTKLHQP